MSSVGTVLAAFGTLKSAYELVRDLRKSNDPAALKAGIEELTDRLLAAREDAMRVVEQMEELKAENARLAAELAKADDFKKRSEKFTRRSTGFGGVVYVESDVTAGQQSPDYCAHCFENRTISILQPTNVHRMMLCPHCRTTMKV